MQPLCDDWDAAVEALGLPAGVSVIGRSKGVVRVIGKDHVVETIPVLGEDLMYEQVGTTIQKRANSDKMSSH